MDGVMTAVARAILSVAGRVRVPVVTIDDTTESDLGKGASIPEIQT